MSKRLVVPAIRAAAAAAGALACWAGARVPEEPIGYTEQVWPIFRAHCSPCHTEDAASADLDLRSYKSVMGVVQAGKPDSSVLLNRILGKGGLPRMPAGFQPLSDADTATVRRWIEGGAKETTGRQTAHWAFIPPVRPQVPRPADKGWVRNPIDAFVLARLDKEGLAPSPEADRTTLIRRLSLDLIGLSPTPNEVDRFLADTSPNAYEKVVDRLLSSPHYGERMALPWLDAARYADSNGFQQDGDTYQYVWRDWVVRALNANMPFDQFTTEQLAGDLLPNATPDQIAASAFNRCHMLNGEGGAIPEEQRSVNLFDRVDTTATTWLGLTMGCARCHDHKYDPLTQKDYYSMVDFFNRVPETGVPSGSGQYRIADPWMYAGSPQEMKQLEAKQLAADSAQNAWEASQGFEAWRQRSLRDLQTARAAMIDTSSWRLLASVKAKDFDAAMALPTPAGQGEVHPEWVDGTVQKLEGEVTAFFLRRQIQLDHDLPFVFSIGSDDGMVLTVNGKTLLTRKVLRAAVPDSEIVIASLQRGENQIDLKIVNNGGIGGFYFKAYPGPVLPGLEPKLSSPEDPDLRRFYLDRSPDAAPARDKAAAKRQELETFRMQLPRLMVMSDAQPRTTHVFRRGNYTDLGEEVHAAFPAALASGPPPKNRLDLARWITSPANPLAARVAVNRAWQTFFGRGLVRTEENFGVKGEPPSHPELLDWLAVEYRESGWNTKRLHKLIVMSSTYRQSSRQTPKMREIDPANLLLARAPRFRLPSLLLRDVALASSGLLNPKLGGKPVYPQQPKSIWDGLAITLERDFTYPQSTGDDLHRRSLYTFWRRTVSPANMFDASSRQVCTVKPSVTSSPLHALVMLNDVTWVEAAHALAKAVSAKPSNQRLTEAFRRVCARRPTPAELKVLERSLDRAEREFSSNPEARTAFGGGKNAALASVCLAIFNLDEAMTRE